MTETRERLKEVIVRALMLEGVEPASIGDEDPLFGKEGLGLDSVDALELAIHIEEEFGVKVPETGEGRKAFASVATLAAFVDAAKGP